MKISSYLILLSVLLKIIFGFNSFADENRTSLNNWIEIKDNDGSESGSMVLISFDKQNENFILNAEITGSDTDTDFSFPSFGEFPVNQTEPTIDNCDFTGGWIGTTDQGNEIIFLVNNISDINRIQIDVVLNTRSCNKNFGTGFSGEVGAITDNRFRISDIVVCGVRLGINGVFTTCNDIEGEWFFYCPSCGSASGTWNAALDVNAPQKITGFNVISGDAQVSLSWVNPPDTDLKGIRVQRSQTSPPLTPDEGTTVFNSLSSGFVDACVSNGKQYFYTAFAFDKVSNFSQGVNITVTLGF